MHGCTYRSVCYSCLYVFRCIAAVPRTTDKQICLVGKVAEDPTVVEAAGTFGVPVVTSSTGKINMLRF